VTPLNGDTLKAAALTCKALEDLTDALAKSSNIGLFHMDEVKLCFEGETIGVFRPEDDWWNYFPGDPSSK
jgi:hypothetical protein